MTRFAQDFNEAMRLPPEQPDPQPPAETFGNEAALLHWRQIVDGKVPDALTGDSVRAAASWFAGVNATSRQPLPPSHSQDRVDGLQVEQDASGAARRHLGG